MRTTRAHAQTSRWAVLKAPLTVIVVLSMLLATWPAYGDAGEIESDAGVATPAPQWANDPLASTVQEQAAIDPAVTADEKAVAGTSADCPDCGEPVLASGVPLTLFQTFNVRGSYTWSAIGLRNLGSGTFSTYVPPGSTIYRAYVYWTILDTARLDYFKNVQFAGHAVSGTAIGKGPNPCWLSPGNAYSYRADVTAYVSGAGSHSYSLSNVASGRTDGADPWSTTVTPMAEGATLIVIYTNPKFPQILIKLYNGNYSLLFDEAATLTVNGFTASNPVGAAYGLFIGADGQSAAEPATKFNGFDLGIGWDGTTAYQPVNYAQGNLWDTQGVQLGRLIRPGATSATVKVRTQSGGDCLVWVAFVFSLTNGTADTDGDALLDGWEINGYDDNGDGAFDFYLPGAYLLHKDMYVEVDWMADAAHSHAPVADVRNRAVAMFAASGKGNPDGIKGIDLHVEYSNSVAHQNLLGTWNADGSYNWAAFDVIKNANFNSTRRKIYHYSVFIHNISASGISGISRGIPASDFIVALGSWTGGVGSIDQQTGTFVHELGHNLNLTHGGADHEGYKANYLSVMNYSFQMSGLYKDGSWGVWDYQRKALPALDENALNENAGLNSANANTYGTSYYCKNTYARRDVSTANGPIDWNCSGAVQAAAVASDINKTGTRSVLSSQNNWANIVYNGGAVGAGKALAAETLPLSTPADCLDVDTYRLMQSDVQFIDNSR